MKILKSVKGFTLLEILIVLVIIAVLAGLAVPAYSTAVEKSRKQEALTTLAATRSAQMRYFSGKNVFAGAFVDLDFDPTLAVTGNVTHFVYTIGGGGATFTTTATRNALDRPTAVAAYTVTIIQDGTIASSY